MEFPWEGQQWKRNSKGLDKNQQGIFQGIGHSKLDFSFPSGPDFKLHACGPFPLSIMVSER
jgi:hypothetical protein